MKNLLILVFTLPLLFCSPKGPVTYKSSFVGQSKSYLISSKGPATTVKVFDNSEAHIYIEKEEYYGKETYSDDNVMMIPKKINITEHIYYINEKDIVYKYQVWKKRVKPN
jgi:hypothetical protein